MTHTKSGLLIGTAAYLAPEQVAGGRADFRTDVYAAGIMLFELLTGRQPFTGDTPARGGVPARQRGCPGALSLVPGLPPALDSLVALATSRNPDLRPADAGQFLRAITGARHGLPLDVPPPAPYTAPAGALPGAASGLPGAAPVAGLGVMPGGAPRARRLDRGHRSAASGRRAGVASPAVCRSASPAVCRLPAPPSGARPGHRPGGWPQMAAAGWPDPPQNGNDVDVIPGMAAGTAVHPYGVTGTDPYRPATNQTLIVSTSDATYGTTARESRLQRLLFSRRLAYLAGGARRGAGVRPARLVDASRPVHDRAQGHRGVRGDGPGRPARRGAHPGGTTTLLDNSVAKGLVIRTSPANGSRIARGGRVDLVVSPARHMINMPR